LPLRLEKTRLDRNLKPSSLDFLIIKPLSLASWLIVSESKTELIFSAKILSFFRKSLWFLFF